MATLTLPSSSPVKMMMTCVHVCGCDAYYHNECDVVPCDEYCDCPCMSCCIARFAAQDRVCYECGCEDVDKHDHEGHILCSACYASYSSDDESYDGRYDDRSSYNPFDDNRSDDCDPDRPCTCHNCGEAYDPADSDYGAMACSEACQEHWGEDY